MNRRLRKIRWYRRLWWKLFGWRSIKLPIVEHPFLDMQKIHLRTDPKPEPPIGQVFYFDFVYPQKDFKEGLDRSAEEIAKDFPFKNKR